MRELKFRAWRDGEMIYQYNDSKASVATLFNRIYEQHPVMQYVGLKDKNGKEIYELSEINGRYRVEFRYNRYILQHISNSDIYIEFSPYDEYEITREYSPIQKD